MRRHRIFVVICILALALGAGYFLHHGATAGHAAHPDSSPAVNTGTPTPQSAPEIDAATIAHKQSTHRVTSSAPLPPPGTPLKDTYAELKARADAGDGQAASRLVHDMEKCSWIAKMKLFLPQTLPSALGGNDKKLTAEELSWREKSLGHYQKELDLIHNNEAFCAGLDQKEFDTLTPNLLRAAQLGDTWATDCYLSSGVTGMQGLLDHPEWLAEFKQNAIPLARAAIENGDWVAVGIMEHAYGGFFSDFISQVTGTDLAQRYRYLSLQRFGASGDFTAKLDEQISGITPNLSMDQIADGDAWAQEMYARHFDGTSSNGLSNGTNVCQMSDN
ncbi:MAG TPA: hypothetical protein VN599_04075 [Rudaea sp.]|nr:hypothetical protein [Rudaea sp.]